MELSIEIASVPDRENLVIELWCGDRQWGEISQETETPILEIYPNEDEGVWSFNFEELLALLEEAKRRMKALDEP